MYLKVFFLLYWPQSTYARLQSQKYLATNTHLIFTFLAHFSLSDTVLGKMFSIFFCREPLQRTIELRLLLFSESLIEPKCQMHLIIKWNIFVALKNAFFVIRALQSRVVMMMICFSWNLKHTDSIVVLSFFVI